MKLVRTNITKILTAVSFALLLTLCGFTVQSYAVNFGQSPLSDIIYVKQTPNGSIAAVDKNGKVAIFDYFEWKVINNGFSTSNNYYYYSGANAFYNSSTDQLVVTIKFNSYWGGGTNKLCIYDFASNTYVFSEDGSNCEYFVKSNVIYKITSRQAKKAELPATYQSNYWYYYVPQLYKRVGSSWTLVSEWATKPYDNWNNPVIPTLQANVLVRADYDKYEDTVVALFRHYDNSSYQQGVIYYLGSNQWADCYYFGGSDYISSAKVANTYMNIRLLYSNQTPYYYLYSYYNGNYNYNNNNYTNTERRFVRTNDYLLETNANGSLLGYYATKQSSGWYSYWNLQSINLGNPGFMALSYCEDKYGNRFYAGVGGKVSVMDKGGQIQTQTDFYTEYALVDIQRAVTSGSSAQRVLTVIKGRPFTKLVYGELVTGTQQISGITVKSTVGSGYSTLSGTFSTSGPKAVGIGGKLILFEVIEPPALNGVSPITF